MYAHSRGPAFVIFQTPRFAANEHSRRRYGWEPLFRVARDSILDYLLVVEGRADEESTQERGERKICMRAGDGGRVEDGRAPLGRNRGRHRERVGVRLAVRGCE